MANKLLRIVLIIAVAAVGVGLIIQLIPYGRDHSNPPVVQEPVWNSADTRALAVRACYDCHSNETAWPGYSNIAPMSWFIQNHVEEGRDRLNFSEWQRPQRNAEEAAEMIAEGEMPPWNYLIMHPEARLSVAEKQALMQGLQVTVGGNLEGQEGDDD